jgi:hypothetical protein
MARVMDVCLAPATTTPATRRAPAAPAPATGTTALLAALRANGIEASPRTLAAWMETADKLCMALATYYRAAEPQAVRTISALEESASEFRLIDV